MKKDPLKKELFGTKKPEFGHLGNSQPIHIVKKEKWQNESTKVVAYEANQPFRRNTAGLD